MILRAWPPGAARLSKLLIGAPTIAWQRAGHFVRPPKARSHPENLGRNTVKALRCECE